MRSPMMNVLIRVFTQELNMRINRRGYRGLHTVCEPRPIEAMFIPKGYGKPVRMLQSSRHCVTRWQGHRDPFLGFGGIDTSFAAA
jgi:hypothetical protein